MDSGRGGDYSTTVSHITSNTSMRRDRFIAASHYGSQRSLWCELPEVFVKFENIQNMSIIREVLLFLDFSAELLALLMQIKFWYK